MPSLTVPIKFIVDSNVGKLARWLRIMGYDALFFKDIDDNKLVRIALSQDRVILTKDRQVLKRKVIISGKLKAVLIEDDDPKAQLAGVIKQLDLNCHFRPFSLCLECNKKLIKQSKDRVCDRVPQYVFETQDEYMECPECRRVYWQGTHWESMCKELERITSHI